MTVRRAETRDVPAIARLESTCFSDPWSESAVSDQLSIPYAYTWVAEMQGETVGYLTGTVLAPECEIHRVATAPARRRQGIGAALLRFALAEMKGMGGESVWLEVRDSNVAAKSLYLSAGFSQTGIRKNYYRHPTEDAAMLVKGLLC